MVGHGHWDSVLQFHLVGNEHNHAGLWLTKTHGKIALCCHGFCGIYLSYKGMPYGVSFVCKMILYHLLSGQNIDGLEAFVY